MGEIVFSLFYGGLMLVMGLIMYQRLQVDFKKYAEMEKKS